MLNNKMDIILACRVTGTRLYGKPLQFIDIEKRITIVEYLIQYMQQSKNIRKVCLAISEEKENFGFIRLAESKGWDYILGDPINVLGRIVKAIEHLQSETVILSTSENPFMCNEFIDDLYIKHFQGNYDYSMVSNLPEGTNFAIIKASALKTSQEKGENRHRSELVTSYIFDHQDQFKLNIVEPEAKLKRSEVRLTVDYPEDLIFCRQVFQALRGRERLIPVSEIIDFWDKHPNLRKPLETIGIDWGHGRLWE